MSERREFSLFRNSFFDIQTWERDRRGMPSCRSSNTFVFPLGEPTVDQLRAFKPEEQTVDPEPREMTDDIRRKKVLELEERFKQAMLSDGYPIPD